MCQRYISAEPQRDPGPRRGERAERALDAHQPARDRAHDHAREREQQQHAARCRRAARAGACARRRGSPRRGRRAGGPSAPAARAIAGRRRRRLPGRPGAAAALLAPRRGGSGARRSPPAARSARARTGRAASGSAGDRRERHGSSPSTRAIVAAAVPDVATPPRASPGACAFARARRAVARGAALLLGVRRARRGRGEPLCLAVPRASCAGSVPSRWSWRGSRSGRRWPTRARRGRSCAALKYRGAAGLAEPHGGPDRRRRAAGLLAAPAALVPVPLHPRRRAGAGYNQAERLARRAGAPHAACAVADCLRPRAARRGARSGRGPRRAPRGAGRPIAPRRRPRRPSAPCSWTTSPPPAPRSPPAPRRSERAGTRAGRGRRLRPHARAR